MSQKLSGDNFEWRKDFLRFDEEFIQNHDEDSDKGHIPNTSYAVIYHS